MRGDQPAAEDLAWERECLLRIQRGEREAFAELYRAFAPRLYSQVLMPRLGNAAAAEDALSETFSALLEHAARLDVGERSVFHWLARVAGNKAIDMHRKKARTQRSLASFERLLAPLVAHQDPLAEGEHEAARARVQQTVGQVLDALNPRYRRALELRFLQEQSRERCAEVMEVRLGTFDVLLLRALRAFRKQWEALVVAAEAPVREAGKP